MNPLLTPMKSDIDIKNAKTGDLVNWYNENSGTKPIAKFKDRASAEKRCSELKTALADLAGGSSKGKKKDVKLPKAPASGDTSTRAAGSNPPGRKSTHAGMTLHKLVVENPRRADTHGFNSFAAIKDGMSYEDYVAAGGRPNDLRYDVEHKFVELRKPKA